MLLSCRNDAAMSSSTLPYQVIATVHLHWRCGLHGCVCVCVLWCFKYKMQIMAEDAFISLGLHSVPLYFVTRPVLGAVCDVALPAMYCTHCMSILRQLVAILVCICIYIYIIMQYYRRSLSFPYYLTRVPSFTDMRSGHSSRTRSYSYAILYNCACTVQSLPGLLF